MPETSTPGSLKSLNLKAELQGEAGDSPPQIPNLCRDVRKSAESRAKDCCGRQWGWAQSSQTKRGALESKGTHLLQRPGELERGKAAGLQLHGQLLAFEADVGTPSNPAACLLPALPSPSSRVAILCKGFLLAAGGQLMPLP